MDRDAARPLGPTGPESVRETVRRLCGAFDDLRFEVHDEVAEGDLVVHRVTMSGRHCGPLMASQPTGRRFAVQQVYGWRVANGRIVEHWGKP